eukprot:scaffold624_cov68-Phaeocystis_antarctica.AAC.1
MFLVKQSKVRCVPGCGARRIGTFGTAWLRRPSLSGGEPSGSVAPPWCGERARAETKPEEAFVRVVAPRGEHSLDMATLHTHRSPSASARTCVAATSASYACLSAGSKCSAFSGIAARGSSSASASASASGIDASTLSHASDALPFMWPPPPPPPLARFRRFERGASSSSSAPSSSPAAASERFAGTAAGASAAARAAAARRSASGRSACCCADTFAACGASAARNMSPYFCRRTPEPPKPQQGAVLRDLVAFDLELLRLGALHLVERGEGLALGALEKVLLGLGRLAEAEARQRVLECRALGRQRRLALPLVGECVPIATDGDGATGGFRIDVYVRRGRALHTRRAPFRHRRLLRHALRPLRPRLRLGLLREDAGEAERHKLRLVARDIVEPLLLVARQWRRVRHRKPAERRRVGDEDTDVRSSLVVGDRRVDAVFGATSTDRRRQRGTAELHESTWAQQLQSPLVIVVLVAENNGWRAGAALFSVLPCTATRR